jgi:TolB-like protein
MERRLSAILAADVVGYTKLMEDDESGTLAALKAHRAGLFDPRVANKGGRIVKLMGDGTLVEFDSIVGAVECAVEILNELQADENSQISLRIGIHLGDVIVDGEDIYGDGVNIATRLESLARPGGLCVSTVVHESVNSKLEISFIDGGEKELKNISRPIRVFQWTPSGQSIQALATEPVPSRPSIAVLPFENMSGDPDQEYFSEGVSEDIITELSRFSELLVVARSSSFVFRSNTVDTQKVGQKLNVQFLVEGSVRRVGNRVRVTAQLIDPKTGAHLWADRYDRKIDDIFEAQDEIVRAIVAVLPGRIARAGAESSRQKPTNNLTALDHLLRGNHAIAQRGDNLKTAIAHYQKAIEIDPTCASAFAGISLAEGMSIWDLSTYADDPVTRSYDAGKRALELNSSDYKSQAAFGQVTRQLGQYSVARKHLQRAKELNPNSAEVLGFWAMLQNYTGNPEGGVETYNQAIRLDPLSQDNVRKEILAEAYYMMREYTKSIDVLESMLVLPIFYVHQQLAICYAQLSDQNAVDRHMQLYRAELPENYDEHLLYESHLRLCQLEKDRDHWREGYRLIGMDV